MPQSSRLRGRGEGLTGTAGLYPMSRCKEDSEQIIEGRKMSSVAFRESPLTIPTYVIGEPEKNPVFYTGRTYQGAKGPVYPTHFWTSSHAIVRTSRTARCL